MADAIFEDPRLARIYDPLDGDRVDLAAYLSLVEEFDVRSVVDIGCGTGSLACLLASRGIEVVGVDPAAASLDVARGKPGSERVQWLLGTAETLPRLAVDLVTMTGNVAQVFLTDEEWDTTLRCAHAALRPGGRLVFETRDPERRGWLQWNRRDTFVRKEIAEVGTVENWVDLLSISGALAHIRATFVFAADGSTVTSDSTLRFRHRDEVTESLHRTGFVVEDVRGAPDRPGRELVFIARRGAGAAPA